MQSVQVWTGRPVLQYRQKMDYCPMNLHVRLMCNSKIKWQGHLVPWQPCVQGILSGSLSPSESPNPVTSRVLPRLRLQAGDRYGAVRHVPTWAGAHIPKIEF